MICIWTVSDTLSHHAVMMLETRNFLQDIISLISRIMAQETTSLEYTEYMYFAKPTVPLHFADEKSEFTCVRSIQKIV
jgi:hypothetical protein